MNVILFDDKNSDYLLPLTFMRPMADMRCGILTIKEKWEYLFKDTISYFTRDYLRKKFQCVIKEENIFINGSLFASKNILDEFVNLKSGQALIGKDKSELLGFKISNKDFTSINLLKNDNIISEHLVDFEFINHKNDYIKIFVFIEPEPSNLKAFKRDSTRFSLTKRGGLSTSFSLSQSSISGVIAFNSNILSTKSIAFMLSPVFNNSFNLLSLFYGLIAICSA